MTSIQLLDHLRVKIRLVFELSPQRRALNCWLGNEAHALAQRGNGCCGRRVPLSSLKLPLQDCGNLRGEDFPRLASGRFG